VPPEGSKSRALIVTLAFGLLGFFANLPQINVFAETPLLFGGVFYLAITLLYGPLYGAAAALLIALPPVVLWRHPETALFLVLEALVVGWLVQRRRRPVIADLIYWAVVGTPLAILVFIVLVKYPSLRGWLTVVKYPVNGVLNTMIAEVLVSVPLLQRICQATPVAAARQPLRAQLSHGLLLVATVPLLFLNIVNGQMFTSHQETEAGQRLQEAATAIRQNLEDYVSRHQLALLSLAQAISNEDRFDSDTLNLRLEQSHTIYPGFQTLTVANERGVPIGVHPNRMADGTEVLSRKPAEPMDANATLIDREYFHRTMETRESYISDVIVGRVARQPIVSITAPLFNRKGELYGLVVGSLKLSQFERFDQNYRTLSGAGILILDQRNRVIYSNRGAEYRPLESVENSALVKSSKATGRASFVLDPPDSSQGKGGYLVSRAEGGLTKWRVFVEQPLAEINRQTERYYGLTLA